MKKIILVLVLFFALVLACSSRKLKSNLTPEERLEVAKEMFEDEDYLEAKTQFKIIIMSHPGSRIIDEAQFYLAECHYQLKEYILGAAEYERLIHTFPNSPWVDDAQYKIGMCYFKRSPKYSLDQEYTHKAISEFQRFLEDYPTSELAPEVEKKLQECRDKLARKEYKTGELYRKMGYYESAILYFDSVLESYYDTPYAEKAQYWKAECLRKLNRLEEAKKEFETFIDRYPQSNLIERAMRALESKLSNPREKGREEGEDRKGKP